MPNYNARMADIVESDIRRRAEREQAELRALGLLDSDYAHSRNLTGEPSEHNRTHRASDDCWKRGMRGRTIGVAPGTTPTGIATVAVTIDGVTTIRSAASFNPKTIATKQRKHTESRRNVSEAERMASTIGYIGNVE